MGIVLFELFYKPLPAGMERKHVLEQLATRTKSGAVVVPDDFAKVLYENQLLDNGFLSG